MILLGIDDTDMPGTPGTNQLAKALAKHLADRYRCALIVRHQLWQDSRVPYTSKNSAASLHLQPQGDGTIESLIQRSRDFIRNRSVEGSDPGLCVATGAAEAVAAFGAQCQHRLVTQREARQLARQSGLHLEGLGGTEDGVIGALAAVGLAAGGDDGRVVQIGAWPDDLAGPQNVAILAARGVHTRCLQSGQRVKSGTVDVGKHLRPNYRQKNVVLFARPAPAGSERSCWEAVRLT